MKRVPKSSPYPLLKCPKCGLELRPTFHGWAFASSPTTKCLGVDAKSTYSHPFQVKEPRQ
jgi:hypothetical protein